MDLDDLASVADVNLASAWATFGRNAGLPVEQFGPLTLTASGLPIAFFNGAFLAARHPDPDAAVGAAIEFFARLDVPYLLWVRAGVDDALLATGRAAGLRESTGPPAMALATIGTIPPPPAELTLRMCTDAADLAEHHAVMAAAFGLPIEIAEQLMTESLLDDPDIGIVIGRLGREPITTALLARSGSTAGVYNVATLELHRAKGYGAAATWAAIALGAERGCTHSVLQSSEVGHPVYLGMGFVDVGQYVHLEGPPQSDPPSAAG